MSNSWPFRLVIPFEADLASYAQQILEAVKPYRKLAFSAEMGAGKTTIIKALCKALEVGSQASSPSFGIINEYNSPDLEEPVYHMDLYRIEESRELADLGIEHYFDSGAWCFIEWPELAEAWMDDRFLIVKIELGADQSRQIEISPYFSRDNL
jgi:tRNA threonylcarbamoyladenosine biosynthesis protein TsaE